MTNLLIVDDHPLFRNGFAHMVRALRPLWMLTFADTAAQARALVTEIPLDLAVIDIGLPGDDGFVLLKAIALLLPLLPQILISGRDDAAVMVRAQSSGARGFLTKAMEPELMIDAIDTVLAGGTAFATGTPLAIPKLTLRQAEILDLLAAGHGNKEIRYRLDIAERTVRAHLTDLFQLLGANSRMQALIRARELGLIA